MAFYFALLNVSAKRDDRSSSSTSYRQKRRRHSIASVESPVLDYRLLPRPQVVRNEFAREDREECGQNAENKREKQERLAQNLEHSRSMSSRPNGGVAGPPRAQNSKWSGGGRNVKDRLPAKGMKNADAGRTNAAGKSEGTSVGKSSQAHEKRERQSRALDRGLLQRRFGGMQIASSSRREQQERDVSRAVVNGSVNFPDTKCADMMSKPTPTTPTGRPDGKWRAKRPIVVKRRVSPQESSTSDSRRSSNQSNRSPSRNDSLASSNSSRRTSEAVQSTASPLATLTEPHKLSNISMPSKIADIPRSATLKKVTFENDSSEYVVSSSFLGDRGVLVRRGSGSAVHRRSITQQLSPASVPVNALRPLAQGTAALAGLAYGAALWAPFFGEKERTPDRENVTNHAIEETTRGSRVRRLLRRRSTSDRHVVFGFQNQGFRLVSDETPSAGLLVGKHIGVLVYATIKRFRSFCAAASVFGYEFDRTPSKATLVPYHG